MKKRYFISNGKGNTERLNIFVCKGEGKETETDIELMDEFGNGAGWNTTAEKKGLVEISKEDYQFLYDCIFNYSYKTEGIFYDKAESLVED